MSEDELLDFIEHKEFLLEEGFGECTFEEYSGNYDKINENID